MYRSSLLRLPLLLIGPLSNPPASHAQTIPAPVAETALEVLTPELATPRAHEAAFTRLVQVGAVPLTWVTLATDLVGDWSSPAGQRLMPVRARHPAGVLSGAVLTELFVRPDGSILKPLPFLLLALVVGYGRRHSAAPLLGRPGRAK